MGRGKSSKNQTCKQKTGPGKTAPENQGGQGLVLAGSLGVPLVVSRGDYWRAGAVFGCGDLWGH